MRRAAVKLGSKLVRCALEAVAAVAVCAAAVVLGGWLERHAAKPHLVQAATVIR
jgi:hypothetical protein